MKQNETTYYQSLYQLATILNSARSPDDILRSIVEGVAKAMGTKACSLMLLTPDEKVLLHTAAYGLGDWFVRKGPVSADKSMSETLKDKPVIVLDATTDDRVEYRKQVKQEGIASILSVPVKLREEVIGVMRIYTSEARHFTNADISFATAAADFGAIALESARFYETLQKDYDAIRQEIRQRRADIGYEGLAEPPVVPPEEEKPVAPPGG
jgi:signal transduction protein with GAF and PtsI domain